MITNLRFVVRDGKRILQMKDDNDIQTESDWQDVPLIEDEETGHD